MLGFTIGHGLVAGQAKNAARCAVCYQMMLRHQQHRRLDGVRLVVEGNFPAFLAVHSPRMALYTSRSRRDCSSQTTAPASSKAGKTFMEFILKADLVEINE